MPLRPPSDADFERWLRDGTLGREQIEVVRADLASAAPVDDAAPSVAPFSKEQRTKGLNVLNVAYYAGAVLVLAAMGWFLEDNWRRFSPSGVFLTCACYVALFAFLGGILRFRYGYPNAGGLLVTCAVWMIPVMGYALMDWVNLWKTGAHNDELRTLFLGGATAVTGILALRWVRFPFLVFPVAAAIWGMAMATASLEPWDLFFPGRGQAWASVATGLFMITASFLADRRFDMDLAFWGYLFGAAAFWGGLVDMNSNSEMGKAGFAGINLLLIALSVYLDRRIFLVFGSLGLLWYFYHLADRVFSGSPLFPFAVAALGLALILGAVYLQRFAGRMQDSLDRYRPRRFRKA